MHWTFWLDLLVRSSVVLMAGLVAHRLSRSCGAAFRHRLLLWVFALLAVMPLLALALPELPIRFWNAQTERTAVVTVSELSATYIGGASAYRWNWPFLVWLCGVVISCVPLMAGGITVWRIAAHSRRLRRVGTLEILLSDEVDMPMTCGLLRSRVLLPAAAMQWTASRLHMVLRHELAHVRRRDLAWQLSVYLLTALWWFQPLAWILRRTLRLESELACDAMALHQGTLPSAYASELVAMAESAARINWTMPSATIGMIRTDLEERVKAVLFPPNTLRRPGRNLAVGMALAITAISAAAVTLQTGKTATSSRGGSVMKRTILSALLTSAGLSAASVSGVLLDAHGAAISDAKVVIDNRNAANKQETTTDLDGKFSVTGGAPGEYILRIGKAGYASIFREFELGADAKVERQFTMAGVGAQPVADRLPDAGDEPSRPIRVGGLVAQSNLITKVQPVYPIPAKVAGTQGTVELEATISKEGVPTELRVVSSPSDDLSQSSLEAVRQWRYRPTLLNGNPIEIVTTVIVHYTLAP